tara:strand:+ start:1016 stop:1402 length:387 start_codon:yes stop_codon:yes gene_type:complete
MSSGRYAGVVSMPSAVLCAACSNSICRQQGCCLHCFNLAYGSQREHEYDQLARRAEKIRVKLGWKPGILNGREWSEFPRMYWKTFDAMIAKYDRLEQDFFRSTLKRIGGVNYLQKSSENSKGSAKGKR